MPTPDPSPRLRPHLRARSLVRSGVLVAVVGLVAAFAAPSAAWSTASVLPQPKAPIGQPRTAEAMQPYVPQTSCDPVMKPGVRKFRDLMLATYPRGTDGGSTRACAGAGVSEHVEGRAWDWMLNASNKSDKAVADAAIAWMLKPGPDGVPALEARRLGIMYVMYNHRIWGTWSGQWKPIRAGSDQHTTHIHLSFSWAGAYGRTSFWTGKVGLVDYGPCAAYRGQPARLYTRPNYKPCPTTLPAAPRSTHKLAWTGTRTTDVMTAQALLKIPAADRAATFGKKLRTAVVAYQRAHGLPVTGALDKATWVRLDPKSRILSTPAPTTSGNATPPPVTTAWTTLKVGMSGPKVLAVQTALKLASAYRTGYFGSVTLASVKSFQQAHGLTVDGVVGPLTARKLGLIT